MNMTSETLYLDIFIERKKTITANKMRLWEKKSANALKLTAKFECDTPNRFRQINIPFQRVNY